MEHVFKIRTLLPTLFNKKATKVQELFKSCKIVEYFPRLYFMAHNSLSEKIENSTSQSEGDLAPGSNSTERSSVEEEKRSVNSLQGNSLHGDSLQGNSLQGNPGENDFSCLIKVYDNASLATKEWQDLKKLEGYPYVPQILARGNIKADKSLDEHMTVNCLENPLIHPAEQSIISLQHHASKKSKNKNSVKHSLRYLIITMCPGIDLIQYMHDYGPFTVSQIKSIIKNLIDILIYIHGKGVSHGDIKPDNIIYDGKNVYIVDFEGRHTPGYRSPEQEDGQPATYKSDVWGVGTTLYSLLTRRTPFSDRRTMKNGELYYPATWDIELKDFVRALIEPDSELRYTMQQARDHIWLNT
jgi:serine/threonine protein kinase